MKPPIPARDKMARRWRVHSLPLLGVGYFLTVLVLLLFVIATSLPS
ncbi:MAG: hypothetical protein WA771_16310 [Chthoniobacterales bacterium]